MENCPAHIVPPDISALRGVLSGANVSSFIVICETPRWRPHPAPADEAATVAVIPLAGYPPSIVKRHLTQIAYSAGPARSLLAAPRPSGSGTSPFSRSIPGVGCR